MRIKTTTSRQKPISKSGNQIGRCVNIIDLGTQHWEYQGKPASGHKVRITWELSKAVNGLDVAPNNKIGELPVFDPSKGHQPFVVSEEYTVSTSPKSNLRPVLEGWLGRGLTKDEEKDFDLDSLLDKTCLVNIIHETSADGSITYANVSSVTPMMDGMECPPAMNPLILFDQDKDNAEAVFATLHDFLKKKIEQSDEWKSKHS